MGKQKSGATRGSSLFAGKTGLDPGLSSLFASSPRTNGREHNASPISQEHLQPQAYDDQDAASEQSFEDQDFEASESEEYQLPASLNATDSDGVGGTDSLLPGAKVLKKRKRKDEELEDLYLQRLEREEAKEQAQRREERNAKSLKQDSDVAGPSTSDEDGTNLNTSDSGSEENSELSPPPLHETLEPSRVETELDKAARTVFLANVSTSAITSKTSKRILLSHLGSILPNLPAKEPPHKIESLRFRSTAFAGGVPKKEAYAKKEIMEATTKSTNAYVVYSTKAATREAARKLNGTVVLGRHLRVDEVAHPSQIDHRRCVFVGNLGFVDDESQIKATQEAETGKKQSKARNGDSEEGLWRQFGKAGTVESVRVVRDSKTRVGKGFAYVQFMDQNGVEAALLFNGKSFPPLLPRKLRVVRAKKPRQNQSKPPTSQTPSRKNGKSDKIVNPDMKSLQGRVGKLLGRSGASDIKSARRRPRQAHSTLAGVQGMQKPESFVFEGHRASSKQGNQGLKLRNSGRKKAGKPTNRGAKRAAAWKAKGGNAKVKQ